MKLYFYTLKALWDSQGKIEMYYGMTRVKKHLPGIRSVVKLHHQTNYTQGSLFLPESITLHALKQCVLGSLLSK